MSSYKYEKVAILAEYRANAGLSQHQAANFFGMRHRDSISAWELGDSRPHKRRRSRFILYLLDKLNLRRDHQRFLKIWNDVMVEEWKWQPLSRDELWQYLPDKLKQIAPAKPAVPPFLAPNRPPYNLVGRDNLLRDLKQRLFAGGNLALSAFNGLPGVGKTALAIELANDPEVLNHFKDGVLWARLGRNADVLAELGKWGTALNISPEEMSKLTNIESRGKAIHSAIGMRRMLLISDDAWELKAALTFKIGGPHCAQLTTTRFPEIALRFAGDGTVTIHELNEVDGLSLLAKLAPNVVQTEPGEAKKLVQAVGSLPLALILMGNYLRVKAHSDQPRRIRTTLDQLHRAEKRLSLEEPQSPVEHHPSLPAGAQISLMAVIAISDEALDKPSRHTLRTLSIFPPKPNTFSEEAAVTVSGESVETLDTLYDYGLLETGGLNRYTLHQTIADFAREKLSDPTVYKRLVEYFVPYVEAHETDYDVLDQEASNILTALEAAYTHEMPAVLVRGANAFSDFLETRGLYNLAEHHLHRAREAAEVLNDNTSLVKILLNLEQIAYNRGNFDQTKAYLHEGLVLARKINYREAIVELLTNLGTVEQSLGNFTQAEEYFRKGLAIVDEMGNLEKICRLLQALGVTISDRGDYEQAEKYLQEGLAIARQINHRKSISGLLHNLGMVATNCGDYDMAEVYCREGLTIARELNYHEGVSGLVVNLGVVASLRGNFDEAEKYLQEGLTITRKIGHRQRLVVALQNIGSIAINRGDYVNGEKYVKEGLAIARQIGMLDWVSVFLQNLGEIAIHYQDYDKAQEYLLEGLAIARQIDSPEEIACNLEMIGKLYVTQQKYEQAESAYQEALDTARSIEFKELIGLTLYGLAQVAIAIGKSIEAYRQAQESLKILEAIGHRDVEKVKKWLATLPSVDPMIRQNDTSIENSW